MNLAVGLFPEGKFCFSLILSYKDQGHSSSSNKNKIAKPSVLEVINYNDIFTAI